MGAIISSLLSLIFGTTSRYPPLGDNADTPDEATGLTPRQARAVLVTWDLVRPDLKNHGINFFIRFFKDMPSAQSHFKAFATLSAERLKTDKRLAAHASTVMLSISGIVDNLGDTEVLLHILKTTGKNHKNRGIPKEAFTQLRLTLISFLEDSLKDAFTSDAKEGWAIATQTINDVIFAAYDAASPEEEE